MATNVETVYTPAELADLWHVSAETVRAMCRDRVLGYFPVGRHYRIPESAVIAYREEYGVPASSSR